MWTEEERTYGNDFGPDEGEGSLGHDRPPAKESACYTGNAIVLNKGAGILPVAEANAIAVGPATKVKNNTKNNETCDRDHFDRTTWLLEEANTNGSSAYAKMNSASP